MKKKLLFVGAIALFAVAFATTLVGEGFNKISADENPYSLTLDSSNALTTSSTGEQTKTQKTDLGGYDVDFTYTNASNASGKHCHLNENGSLVNKDHILSIGALKVVYTSTGELQFRTSYDANTWSNYATVTNDFEYSLPSRPYYIEFKSVDGSTDITSIKYKYLCQVNTSAESTGSGEYTLINSKDDLVIGDYYVIAAQTYNYAMSTTQSKNNRAQTAITKNTSANTISWSTSSNVCEFQLRAGSIAGSYSFFDEENAGFIYAASSTNNYLRTQTGIDYNSSFSISFSSGYAVITANGTNTRNVIRYNKDNSPALFSCYASGSQQPVVLYRKMGSPVAAPVDEVGFTAIDSKATSYQIGDTFNDVNGLIVKSIMNNGEQNVVEAGNYSYVLRNSANEVVNTANPFTTAGTYTLTVNYKNFIPVEIQITVSEKVLVRIQAVVMEDEYLVTDTFSFTDNLLVDLGYSDSSIVENLEYDDLADYDIAAKLVNPTGVEHNLNEPFGVAGNWKVVVYSITNTSIKDECPIKVTDPTIGSEIYELVTEYSDLVVGDDYIIASVSDMATAGTFSSSTSSSYMNSVTTTFKESGTVIEEVPTDTQIFTLGGSDGAYTFTNKDGKKLGATAAKKVVLDNGTMTWDITLYTDNTIDLDCTTSSYGSMYYNFNNPRFTTYTSYDDNNESYISLFHKKTTLNIYPTSISLSPSSVTIDMYETSQLTINYTPSNTTVKNVTYTSSNSAVATVSSSGLITGVSNGNATITATAKDVNNQNLTATCSVIVNYAEEPALTKTTMQKDMGDYIENNIFALDAAPSSGTAKLLVIPVWFTDSSSYIQTSKKETVRSDIEKAYFGSNTETGWRSVKTYYEEESHGSLTLNGVVSDWYECGKAMSSYTTDDDMDKTPALVEEATNWYFNQTGASRKSFDCDGNGYLDGVMLIYAAPDFQALSRSSYDNLWAYCFWIQDTSNNSKTNPGPNVFFWASYDFMYDSDNSVSSYYSGDTTHCNIDTHTYIHEMGHVFGLEDYYDYSSQYEPAGGFSMQDMNVGGHDPYSCLQLGWAKPYIPTETVTLTINDFQSSGDMVLLTPSWNSYDSPFDEYILVELYSPTGLNKFDSDYTYDVSYPKGPSTVGIRVWHVDARLLYVNSDQQFSASQVTTNPSYNSYYGVYKMMANTYYSSSASDYITYLGQSYANYNELQLIRNNTSTTYKPKNVLSASDLFIEGSTFSMSAYKNQFVNSGKLNSNIYLGWTFTVNSISGCSASITFTKA